MDATILTTFFSFIILVLVALLFIRMYHLQALIEHHIDLTISEKEHSRTALKILQHLEAQVHLMFNNAPSAPGEVVLPNDWGRVNEDKDVVTSSHWCTPEMLGVTPDMKGPVKAPRPMLELARQKLKEHQIKIKPPQLPKKRGRPKKASSVA